MNNGIHSLLWNPLPGFGLEQIPGFEDRSVIDNEFELQKARSEFEMHMFTGASEW